MQDGGADARAQIREFHELVLRMGRMCGGGEGGEGGIDADLRRILELDPSIMDAPAATLTVPALPARCCSAPSFKTAAPTSRTQLKLQLMREQQQQEEQREAERQEAERQEAERQEAERRNAERRRRRAPARPLPRPAAAPRPRHPELAQARLPGDDRSGEPHALPRDPKAEAPSAPIPERVFGAG